MYTGTCSTIQKEILQAVCTHWYLGTSRRKKANALSKKITSTNFIIWKKEKKIFNINTFGIKYFFKHVPPSYSQLAQVVLVHDVVVYGQPHPSYLCADKEWWRKRLLLQTFVSNRWKLSLDPRLLTRVTFPL